MSTTNKNLNNDPAVNNTVTGGVINTSVETQSLTVNGSSILGLSTGAIIDSNGILRIDNATDSTTTTDGAMIIDGGVGIGKSCFIGTDLDVTGATTTGSITAGNTTALTVSSLGILQVNNATDSTVSTDGAMIIDGGVGIGKSCFIGTDLDVSGETTLASSSGSTTIGSTTPATVGSFGILQVNNTTEAVSSLTGAVIISGGVGINKKLFVNSQIRGGSATMGSSNACSITALGQIIITNTNNANSATSGSLKSQGGISCEKDIYVGLDLNVDGVIMVDSTKVVGNQGAAVADATDAATAISQLNLLLARCRAHGLIV
jgi:hypothetical protein